MVVRIPVLAAEWLERLRGGAASCRDQLVGRNGGCSWTIPVLRERTQLARGSSSLQILMFSHSAFGHLSAFLWLNRIALHNIQSCIRGVTAAG